MKNLIKFGVIQFVILFISTSAFAQEYQLIRTIKHFDKYTVDHEFDTTSGLSSTGNMIIDGNKLTRNYKECDQSQCFDFVRVDQILEIIPSGKGAVITGDSGHLVNVSILSLEPTIIILQPEVNSDTNFHTLRVDEYKLIP